jgi:AcrR family transcriptional regulator
MNVKREPTAATGAAPAPARTTKAEQSEATRGALVEAARPLFAERGYAAVATEEIVRAAGVTRGALYHHFAGKEDLFAAVYEQVEADLVAEIGQVATDASDPLDALHLGAARFLEACRRPEVQRITLIDAPSVLGWERWREIGMSYGFGLIEEVLRAGMEQGVIEPQPLRPLTHLLLGAMDEAAMLVARSDDPELREQVAGSIDRYLDTLAPRAS